MSDPEMENRPAANEAIPISKATTAILAAELRQRKEAALRLPPLESGLRDPLMENRAAPTESSVRSLCRDLYKQGFSVDYLEHRFGVQRLVAVNN